MEIMEELNQIKIREPANYRGQVKHFEPQLHQIALSGEEQKKKLALEHLAAYYREEPYLIPEIDDPVYGHLKSVINNEDWLRSEKLWVDEPDIIILAAIYKLNQIKKEEVKEIFDYFDTQPRFERLEKTGFIECSEGSYSAANKARRLLYDIGFKPVLDGLDLEKAGGR